LTHQSIHATNFDLLVNQYLLERATLYAPIAGSVAELNLTVGELAGPGAPAIILATCALGRSKPTT
jgi:multidrug resistance efflux pump